jgi:hypothetical protein
MSYENDLEKQNEKLRNQLANVESERDAYKMIVDGIIDDINKRRESDTTNVYDVQTQKYITEAITRIRKKPCPWDNENTERIVSDDC